MATLRNRIPRDLSPKWDGAETCPISEFNSRFRGALRYYSLEFGVKDLKPQIINWMGSQGYSKTEIDQYKKTQDWRTNSTMGGIAASLLKGMPASRPDFNNGRNSADWLRTEIARIVREGKNDQVKQDDDQDTKTDAKKSAVVVNIQDRIREQASQMSEELDYAIDSWIQDPDAFDPKSFKIVNLLKGRGAKAAQARYIKGFFQRGMDELHELASGNADEQLREAYKHNSRKNVKKLIDFYEGIAAACDQIAQEAKVLKKPRTKKVKPATELVKKLKFKLTDEKMAITSAPPANIIGAQSVVVYNSKTRKIGYYVASSSAGLSVKNSSITDFTAKSVQKTLRKPELQIKEFKDQNTQKRVETWISKIKTTETMLNGRMNEDIVILKIFK